MNTQRINIMVSSDQTLDIILPAKITELAVLTPFTDCHPIVTLELPSEGMVASTCNVLYSGEDNSLSCDFGSMKILIDIESGSAEVIPNG